MNDQIGESGERIGVSLRGVRVHASFDLPDWLPDSV
jgi:hypothetical protein